MASAVQLPESFQMTSLQVPRRPGLLIVRPPNPIAPIAFDCKPSCPPPAPCDASVREFSGSYVSILYLNVALVVGLARLASAGERVLWLVCPIWSAAVLSHAFSGSARALVCGIGLTLSYPCLVILRDPHLFAAYILCFAVFASYGFWDEQRGPWLVLCAVFWIGVIAGAAAGIVFPERPVFLEGSGLCALILAVVCTRRLARFRYKIVPAQCPRE